jgi:hypothetical protein
MPNIPKNTWLIPAQIKDRGSIGPVFAIYKIYSAVSDTFKHVLKTRQEIAYENSLVIDGELRLVAVMLVDTEALIGALPVPKQITGLDF